MKVFILCPVFNDWVSLGRLLQDLQALETWDIARVLVVDDASVVPLEPHVFPEKHPPVTCIRLNTNMGHQRAIALGMSYLEAQPDLEYDALVVMDSDGEDQVSDIPELLKNFELNDSKKLIFAERTKRSENLKFRLFYRLYKLMFAVLTGKRISFGNFSCLPKAFVKKLIYYPDIWNHYSACVLKSELPYCTVATERGTRYSGCSKMNFNNLLLHGLSSISVYLDDVSIRLLAFSMLGVIIGGVAIFITVIIRLTTDLAVPGWATYVSLMLLNVISLMFVVSLLGLMLRLNNRNSILSPPAISFADYIQGEELFPGDSK